MDLDQVWREQWGRLLALLISRTRRIDLAEDALADAFAQATQRWPRDGAPDNPASWLLVTAQRRIIDQIRAEAMAAKKLPLIALAEEQVSESDDEDALLRLVMLAAHPALNEEAGAALTLRLVLGISTADIARLFLVPEPTMAARLTRAKKKVVAAGIPMAIPDATVLPDRLARVARVAYLAFTAGYAPTSGPDVVRVELAGEAIRLVRMVLATQRAGNSTLQTLLALMVLQHSRRDARTDETGQLVLLPDQDRTRWHASEIAEGLALIEGLAPVAQRGFDTLSAAEFFLQALIAAEHARAARPTDTRWQVIADLYQQLAELTGSPIVTLNRAVAVAEAGSPDLGLELLDTIADELRHTHRLPAVRAELLFRNQQVPEALAELARAITMCHHEGERAVLEQKMRDWSSAL